MARACEVVRDGASWRPSIVHPRPHMNFLFTAHQYFIMVPGVESVANYAIAAPQMLRLLRAITTRPTKFPFSPFAIQPTHRPPNHTTHTQTRNTHSVPLISGIIVIIIHNMKKRRPMEKKKEKKEEKLNEKNTNLEY